MFVALSLKSFVLVRISISGVYWEIKSLTTLLKSWLATPLQFQRRIFMLKSYGRKQLIIAFLGMAYGPSFSQSL